MRKIEGKMMINFVMAILLLLSMMYALIGEKTHEYIGTILIVLFITHNILNISWYKNLCKGNYNLFRTFNTLINILLLLFLISIFVSGMIFASYTPDSLKTVKALSWARFSHMMGAYWGFILISCHLGLHLQMINAFIKKKFHSVPIYLWKILKFASFLVAIYGIVAFLEQDMISYLLMQNEFAFFDNSQSIVKFLFDYVAMMIMCICFMQYLLKAINYVDKKCQNMQRIKENTVRLGREKI